MQIRLQELAAMPGHRARFDYTIDLSQEEVGFEFPFQKPVRLEGEVSDDAGAITLSATVHACVSTRCARCGKPFTAYGNAGRKYCSHSCYIADRFKGGDGNE